MSQNLSESRTDDWSSAGQPVVPESSKAAHLICWRSHSLLKVVIKGQQPYKNRLVWLQERDKLQHTQRAPWHKCHMQAHAPEDTGGLFWETCWKRGWSCLRTLRWVAAVRTIRAPAASAHYAAWAARMAVELAGFQGPPPHLEIEVRLCKAPVCTSAAQGGTPVGPSFWGWCLWGVFLDDSVFSVLPQAQAKAIYELFFFLFLPCLLFRGYLH